MGNNLASIVINFNTNREADSMKFILPDGVTAVYSNGLIIWTLDSRYGSFDQLKLVMNQVPASMGNYIFYKVLRTIPLERKVHTAFFDQLGNIVRAENLGRYAGSYKNGSVINYEVQGNMTITSGGSSIIPKSIDPFRYVVPSVRSFSSANTTVDSNGVFRYDGQIVTGNPDLTQIEVTTLSDLNNSNGQYMLDMIIKNESSKISVSYTAIQCPNVTSVVYENDNININLNIDSPSISMVYNVIDASLGITTTPNLYLTRINPRLFRLSVTNSSITSLMSGGTFLNLSLLLLPLA